jgi:AraC-like DNA-binding protein
MIRRVRAFPDRRSAPDRRQAQIDRARELLTTTSLKISIIAKQVGMDDCSRFIRYFKQWSGATPAAYRRMHRP